MTEQQRDKMVEKIRRLLALSQSSNEHEAAAAAAKAQSLLAEYNLSLSDIEVEEVSEDIIKDEEMETDSYPWRRNLGVAVAKLYFCTYLYSSVTRYKLVGDKHVKQKIDKHIIIGAAHNVMVAKMMLEYLHRTVDRLAKEGALSVPPKERSPYRVTFRHTCAIGLCRRIAERIEESKKGPTVASDGRNLPALASLYEQTKAKLDAFLAEEYKGGIKKEIIKARNLHAKGSADGKQAGETIGLDQQVGNKKQHYLAKD